MRRLGVKSKCLIWVAFVVVMIFANPALSADHYIRDGASGDGSSWANACDDFADSCAVSSLVRGDTYYVATGTYAARTWNRATSGTDVITIKRATVAAHGADSATWQDAYDGHVTWGYTQTFSSNYWVFDGVTSPETPVSTGADNYLTYGFSVATNSGTCGSNYSPIRISASNVTIAHIGLPNACVEETGTIFGIQFGSSGSVPCSNNTISHIFTERNCGDFQRQSYELCDNNIFEYHRSRLLTHKEDDPNQCHGEIFALGGDNNIIRWNYWERCNGTGCVASNGPSLTNFEVYGNVMNWVARDISGGNGAVSGAGAATLSGFKIYNNTIIQPTHNTTPENMTFGWMHTNGGPGGNDAKNNIIMYNCVYDGEVGDTTSYNTYLSCLSGHTPYSETGRQTGSFDPFVDSIYAPGLGDYRLNAYEPADCSSTSILCAGTSLSAPYNVDMFGNTRGADGVWDRGAFEYNSGSDAPVLVSPIDSATAGWPVLFTWEIYTGAVRYHIQVDNDQNFGSPEIDDDTLDPDEVCDETDCGFIVGYGEELSANTTYYWRMRVLR